MAYTIVVEGTSEPYDFVLRNNGSALDGTGLTVALEIFRAGAAVSTPPIPSVAWLSQGSGTVRVTGMQHLTKGTYRVRYRLEDGGTLKGYAPNQGEADVWNVVKVQS